MKLVIEFTDDNEADLIPLLMLHTRNIKLIAELAGVSLDDVKEAKDMYNNLLRELSLTSARVYLLETE